MNRNKFAFFLFLGSGIASGFGVFVNELGPYHGGLSTMIGIAYAFGMFIAAYLVYRTSELNLFGLRKTTYYRYSSMELEWYSTATPTTCGCCLAPLLIIALVFVISTYENLSLSFFLLLFAAVLGMLGGFVYQKAEEYQEDEKE